MAEDGVPSQSVIIVAGSNQAGMLSLEGVPAFSVVSRHTETERHTDVVLYGDREADGPRTDHSVNGGAIAEPS